MGLYANMTGLCLLNSTGVFDREVPTMTSEHDQAANLLIDLDLIFMCKHRDDAQVEYFVINQRASRRVELSALQI
jgi:hypothetical protein